MPTYEYQCSDCHYRFEEFQSMHDDPISVCPQCQGKTERLISGGAGFLFKGSGFYITDYRSDNYKKAAEKDKPSLADSKIKSDASSKDNKPSTANKNSKKTE